MLEQGKIVKFADLDIDIQNLLLFSTEEELAKRGFIFIQILCLKRESYLWLFLLALVLP